MTNTLNQIFFFLHQNQNIFSATMGIRALATYCVDLILIRLILTPPAANFSTLAMVTVSNNNAVTIQTYIKFEFKKMT